MYVHYTLTFATVQSTLFQTNRYSQISIRIQHGRVNIKEWRETTHREVQAPRIEKHQNVGIQKKTKKTHQKSTLYTFEKRGIQEAKLWWRRLTLYNKMTQNIDLNEMTTDRELSQHYRDELEHRIKNFSNGHWENQQ